MKRLVALQTEAEIREFLLQQEHARINASMVDKAAEFDSHIANMDANKNDLLALINRI